MNTKLKTLVQALIEEINGTRGENDAKNQEQDWWRILDWKTPEYRELFDSLGEETRLIITDAGLCPSCEDEDPECEEGYEKNEEGECVKMKEETEDVLESNPGFKPGKAEEECPEGKEWNAERKQCVSIEDFSGDEKKKKKLDPREALERANRLL